MSRPHLLHQAEAPFKIPASTAITDLFLTAALRHGGVIGADVTARKTSQEKLSGGAHADVDESQANSASLCAVAMAYLPPAYHRELTCNCGPPT